VSGDEGDGGLAAFSALLEQSEVGESELVAQQHRQRRRRRIAGLVVSILILSVIGTYVPMTLLAPAGTAPAAVTVPQPPAQPAAELAMPRRGQSAVSVTGGDDFAAMTGTAEMVASAGTEGARPIASISKVITALVVLDEHPLGAGEQGPTLVFSEADEDLYDKYYLLDATIQPMDAGSTMSLHDVLELMLVVSASNYAEAAANWAFGSPAGFRTAADGWLAANGLSSTGIVEPTGIDARNVSTAADLIALGKLAAANPVVAEIARMPALDVPGFPALTNTNGLLGVDGVTGIKTGTLDEGGACLVFSASLDVGLATPLTVIGAVLGAPDHAVANAEVRALLASITAGFHNVVVMAEGQELGTYTTPWGDGAVVVATESASVFTWSDAPITSDVETTPITEGASGTQVGSITFTAGTSELSVPLALQGSITGPDPWWRLTHPLELLGH